MESEIISACRNYNWYDKYRKYIKPEMVSRYCHEVLLVLDKFYTTEKKDISVQDLLTLVKITSSNVNVIALVQDITPSPVLVQALEQRYYFSKIAELSLDIVETGTSSPDDVKKLVEEYYSRSSAPPEADTSGIDDLFNPQAIKGFSWPIQFLDQAIGPCVPGSMVLFGARPEVGKTSILAQVVSHMSRETDQKIVVFLNEEPLRSAKARYVQSLLNKTRAEIQVDVNGALAEIQTALGAEFNEKFKFYHNPSMDIESIRSVCNHWKPSIIVVDQLRNVPVRHRTGTDVERLKHLYEAARRMASEQQAVFFTVHQAGGAAEGMQYIPGNMLEGCQTEVQGALDLQIMIGKDNDPMNAHLRYFNIVKNKLPGCKDESIRHGRQVLSFDPQRARMQ